MTVGYPGNTKGMPWKKERYENSSRADRFQWGLEQHLWEHFKRPRVDYSRKVNLPVGLRDAFNEMPKADVGDPNPSSIFRDIGSGKQPVYREWNDDEREVVFVPEAPMTPVDEQYELEQWQWDKRVRDGKDYVKMFDDDMQKYNDNRAVSVRFNEAKPKGFDNWKNFKQGAGSDWSYPDPYENWEEKNAF